MPRLVAPLVLSIVVVSWIGSPVHADWIRLKDGAQIHGRIILMTDERITLKSPKGTFSFDRRKVVEVHRTAPIPKTEEQKRKEREAEKKSSAEAATRENAPRAREASFGPCQLNLPLGFNKKKGRSKVEGYDGEILGVYEEKPTESIVSMAMDDTLPLEATDLNDLGVRIRKHLGRRTGTTVHSVRRTSVDSKPAIFANFTEVRGDSRIRHLQAWVVGEKCYAVSIAVPDRKYRLNSFRYQQILKSFRIRPR